MIDRELDIEVATKILGWTDVRREEVEDHFHRLVKFVSGLPAGERIVRYNLPLFSTEIEMAWKVVEKMKSSWEFSLSWLVDDFVVVFSMPGESTYGAECRDKSAAKAICLGALRALSIGALA